MLEVKRIREERDDIVNAMRKRNVSEEVLTKVDLVLSLDDRRKEVQFKLDSRLEEANRMAKRIGQLFREGKAQEAEGLKQQVSENKSESKAMEEELRSLRIDLMEGLLDIPNVPHESVPSGKGEADNEVFKAWGNDLPDLGENALPHWELAAKYGLIDFDMGVQLTGSGFPVFRGKGARLERALINFFLDEGHKEGYTEYAPPLLVNEDTARATGQLPDKEGQMYHVTKDNLYLIPTAEVPLTNIYRDVILTIDDLPVKLTGYTPCFRREAGSYGSDVKGLNRVHQFDKVEIVQIAHPDQSYAILDEMLDHVEGLLKKLELPYRILRLCGGDLGFTSALTFDFEVWSAAQKKWLEVSSVSNFETYQSNRLKLRFRHEGKKTQLLHTLNGSALALARIVAALLENMQTAEGIRIPEALKPYTGFDIID